ncbi:hypothetical protein [Catenuloplanes japonicus]|uniref:hypothetical protein n=1 Tax=Catenuloplanes japonicus TaxID=33876 RepID=UPI00068E1837|nr:hypothetical protein [Catenuloplanes japonicus]
MQVQILSLVVGIILPILVGVVTSKSTSPGVKAVLLALLSAVSGFLTEYLVALNTAQVFGWGTVGLTWLGTFMVAVAMHFGLWSPTGVAGFVQANVGVTGRDPRPRPALLE